MASWLNRGKRDVHPFIAYGIFLTIEIRNSVEFDATLLTRNVICVAVEVRAGSRFEQVSRFEQSAFSSTQKLDD